MRLGIFETRADRHMGHSNPSVANRDRHQLEGQLVEDGAQLDAYLRGAITGKVVALPIGAQMEAHAAPRRRRGDRRDRELKIRPGGHDDGGGDGKE